MYRYRYGTFMVDQDSYPVIHLVKLDTEPKIIFGKALLFRGVNTLTRIVIQLAIVVVLLTARAAVLFSLQ
jgi:hypothetical protein